MTDFKKCLAELTENLIETAPEFVTPIGYEDETEGKGTPVLRIPLEDLKELPDGVITKVFTHPLR